MRKANPVVPAASESSTAPRFIVISQTKFLEHPAPHISRERGGILVLVARQGTVMAVLTSDIKPSWAHVTISTLQQDSWWKLPAAVEKHGKVIIGIRAPTPEELKLGESAAKQLRRSRFGGSFHL